MAEGQTWVFWNKRQKWGGTHPERALYLGCRGALSCRIRLSNGKERTVRQSAQLGMTKPFSEVRKEIGSRRASVPVSEEEK